MGDVFLDALLDTLKILPFLLVMNLLIELIEHGSKGFKAHKILKGGAAPLIGTAVGVVPQCGFSVVATELYAKRRIALGTLLAVYLATSDEALPIMLSSYAGVTKLLPVLIIKVCFALIVGYAAFAVEKLAEKHNARKPAVAQPSVSADGAQSTGEHKHAHDESAHVELAPADGHVHDGDTVNAHEGEHSHDHEHEHEHEHGEVIDDCVHIRGCHHHSIEGDDAPLSENATKRQKAARVFREYFEHPLIHTATVILFIFAVNVVFGVLVYYVGETRIADFIKSTGYFQPLVAALVGLIPNCAASVVITELYVVGGLNLGGAVAGLCMGAGIGYAVLVKQNRPVKNTVAVIVIMYVLSALLGVCVTACGY